MMCELANKLAEVISYTFEGTTKSDMTSDRYSVVGVMIHFIMFVIVFVCLSWWVIPLRWTGVFDYKFVCDKKE